MSHPKSPSSSTSDSEGLPNKQTSRLSIWLSFALLLTVFYVHAGWPAPDNNEAHYLAKAKHYWSPDWLEGDFFLESNDAHLVFYWTFGWITKFVSLTTAAWIGRLLCWSFLAWGWLRLCLAVRLPPLASVLSGALFVSLMSQFHLAGEWVVGGVEAKGFAYGFIFLGLAAMIRQRWNQVWILLGLASAFHVVVGAWLVVCAAFCWCFAGNERTPLQKMIPGLLLGGAISLFGLVPGVMLTANTPPEVAAEANQIYVFDRLPHHLALLEMRPSTRTKFFGRFIGLTVVFGAICFLTRRVFLTRPTQGGSARKESDEFAATDLESKDESHKESENESKRRLRLIHIFVLATLLVAASGLLLSFALRGNDITAARFLRYYWYRLADVAVPLGVSLTATTLLVRLLRNQSVWGTAVLVALLGFACYHLGDLTLARWSDQMPRSDRSLCRVSGNPQATRDRHDDWLDACAWAKENTPPDSVFLTPRAASTFQYYAHRAQVACWKNLPQDAPAIVEWKSRVDTINPRADDGKRKTLAEQTPERLRKLAEQYGADFVLTASAPRLPLPIEHSNDSFAIYRQKNP